MKTAWNKLNPNIKLYSSRMNGLYIYLFEMILTGTESSEQCKPLRPIITSIDIFYKQITTICKYVLIISY